jgi:bifunctional UDP-N-acetylglucosamine pyrophosphorylase/glucosamine-1-phosphate N-acetyltransferase
MAKEALIAKVQNVIVLYGDMPFITSDSLKKLIKRHEERGNTLTMMTVTVTDFADWRAGLYDYGRVVRGANGHILRTVEKKDASPEELEIKELNPCYCCFKSEWLWENLAKLRNANAQKEYYLTDLVRFAVEQGEKISAIDINPKEAIGVNTLEQLQNAEGIK